MKKRKEKPPAFQFYPQRWLSSTHHMTFEQKGIYIDFLAWSWDNGALPLDMESLAVMARTTVDRFAKLWTVIGRKFYRTSKGFLNKKLESIRKEQQTYRRTQAANGRKSGEKRRSRRERRLNHRSPTVAVSVEPNVEPNSNSPSPISDLPKDQDRKSVVDANASTPLFTPDNLRQVWNDLRGTLAACQALSDVRQQRAKSQIKRYPEASWPAIVDRIAGSRFCNGENDKGWVATFDWLLQADVPAKVLEGKYDNRAGLAVVRGRTRTGDTIDAGKEYLTKKLAQIAAEEGGQRDVPDEVPRAIEG